MIIVLKRDATPEQQAHIVDLVEQWGLTPKVSIGAERTVIGVVGDESVLRSKPLEAFPGVESVMPVLKPYKQVSSEMQAETTRIALPAVREDTAETIIGGREIIVMAGPCAIESYEGLSAIAREVKTAGARMLRGGAFKPRTSPYAFQGMGREGLEILRQVSRETGLPTITEVMAAEEIEIVCEYADMLQVGARNMQNFRLLSALGQARKPVLLKRGMASTIEEWLMSAEYIMKGGNQQILLCERGMRTIETLTRNTLDLSAVPVCKRETHLPVQVDPSHGTGHWDLVGSMALAAVAAGADSLMIEVHDQPEKAASDGAQSLLPRKFYALMQQLRRVAEAVDRSI